MYNPSKKIQKVYVVEDGVKQLSEVWNWNGDLLTSVDNYSGYDYSMEIYTTTFTYDNENRLIAMDNGSSHVDCIYNGKKLEKMVITDPFENTMLGSYEFEHKGSKISKIIMTVDLSSWLDDDDWKRMSMINPMRFLIPDVCSTIESAVKKCSKDAKGETITLDLKWSGNNVKTMELKYAGMFGSIVETVDLTYDNKNNPTYGLLAQLSTESIDNIFLNKNNPLSIVMKVGGMVYDKSTYTYEYEDNYPVKVTCENVEEPGTEDAQSFVYTRIYEY